MRCHQCKKEFSDRLNYCPYCGSPARDLSESPEAIRREREDDQAKASHGVRRVSLSLPFDPPESLSGPAGEADRGAGRNSAGHSDETSDKSSESSSEKRSAKTSAKTSAKASEKSASAEAETTAETTAEKTDEKTAEKKAAETARNRTRNAAVPVSEKKAERRNARASEEPSRTPEPLRFDTQIDGGSTKRFSSEAMREIQAQDRRRLEEEAEKRRARRSRDEAKAEPAADAHDALSSLPEEPKKEERSYLPAKPKDAGEFKDISQTMADSIRGGIEAAVEAGAKAGSSLKKQMQRFAGWVGEKRDNMNEKREQKKLERDKRAAEEAAAEEARLKAEAEAEAARQADGDFIPASAYFGLKARQESGRGADADCEHEAGPVPEDLAAAEDEAAFAAPRQAENYAAEGGFDDSYETYARDERDERQAEHYGNYFEPGQDFYSPERYYDPQHSPSVFEDRRQTRLEQRERAGSRDTDEGDYPIRYNPRVQDERFRSRGGYEEETVNYGSGEPAYDERVFDREALAREYNQDLYRGASYEDRGGVSREDRRREVEGPRRHPVSNYRYNVYRPTEDGHYEKDTYTGGSFEEFATYDELQAERRRYEEEEARPIRPIDPDSYNYGQVSREQAPAERGSRFQERAYRDTSYEDTSYGDTSYGDAPYGEASYGDRPYAESFRAERPQSERFSGGESRGPAYPERGREGRGPAGRGQEIGRGHESYGVKADEQEPRKKSGSEGGRKRTKRKSAFRNALEWLIIRIRWYHVAGLAAVIVLLLAFNGLRNMGSPTKDFAAALDERNYESAARLYTDEYLGHPELEASSESDFAAYLNKLKQHAMEGKSTYSATNAALDVIKSSSLYTGNCKALLDETEKALVVLQQADGFFQGGKEKFNALNYEGAIVDFNKVLELYPGFPQTADLLATARDRYREQVIREVGVLQSQSKFEEAQAKIDRALLLIPEDPALMDLKSNNDTKSVSALYKTTQSSAERYFQAGDFKKVFEVIDEALKSDPADESIQTLRKDYESMCAESILNTADNIFLQGDRDAALDKIKEGLVLMPESKLLRDGLKRYELGESTAATDEDGNAVTEPGGGEDSPETEPSESDESGEGGHLNDGMERGTYEDAAGRQHTNAVFKSHIFHGDTSEVDQVKFRAAEGADRFKGEVALAGVEKQTQVYYQIYTSSNFSSPLMSGSLTAKPGEDPGDAYKISLDYPVSGADYFVVNLNYLQGGTIEVILDLHFTR